MQNQYIYNYIISTKEFLIKIHNLKHKKYILFFTVYIPLYLKYSFCRKANSKNITFLKSSSNLYVYKIYIYLYVYNIV